jgi:hypothetical protein
MFKKMGECVHRTRMSPLPAKVNKGVTPDKKKWYKV